MTFRSGCQDPLDAALLRALSALRGHVSVHLSERTAGRRRYSIVVDRVTMFRVSQVTAAVVAVRQACAAYAFEYEVVPAHALHLVPPDAVRLEVGGETAWAAE